MDFGNFSDNLPLIITVLALVAFQFLFRKKRPAANNASIVQNLLSEISLDIRLTEYFTYDKPGKKFMDTSWKLYQSKLDFLDQSLRGTLTTTFQMIEEYNQQIAAAKKFKSTSYLAALDMSKLKALLEKSHQGLESWYSSNITEDPNKSNIFSGLTGV
jgi:hypothetical protein